jgi:1,4-dihydroxy-2-naphthoate octaprenyltransferase
VVVGTGVAVAEHGVVWWRALLALVVSLCLQVGVNYANDYSDGVRGTDDARVGPVRLVASGLAQPAAVKRAALCAFAVAGLAGLPLAAVTSWWLLAVGAAAMAAAWFYTGGAHPYGYYGFGELFVFVFFGVVATAGTAYVQTGRVSALALVASVPVGLLACALLVVNNLRDIPGDTRAGKSTLAVRIGDGPTRALYTACILAAVALAAAVAALSSWWALLGLLAVALVVPPAQAVLGARARGPALIPVLVATGRLQLAFGALLTLGLVLSR